MTGDYAKLLPALERMKIDQFVLEYATPRAGDIEVVGNSLSAHELGLGVVNPRTDVVEPVDLIVSKAETALAYFKPEQLFLNTDCGFGCFASRSVNVEEIAYKKLCSIVKASRLLREKYC